METPKGASSMWYADIAKGPPEKNNDYLKKKKAVKKYIGNKTSHMSLIRKTQARSDDLLEESTVLQRVSGGTGLVDHVTGQKLKSRLSMSMRDLKSLIGNQVSVQEIQDMLDDKEEEEHENERETLQIPYSTEIDTTVSDEVSSDCVLHESGVTVSVSASNPETPLSPGNAELSVVKDGQATTVSQGVSSGTADETARASNQEKPPVLSAIGEEADPAQASQEENPQDTSEADSIRQDPEAWRLGSVHLGSGREVQKDQGTDDCGADQDAELNEFAKCLMTTRGGDPSSMSWNHEGMLWMRKEQDNSGTVLFEFTTHWKRRFGRLCLWPGSGAHDNELIDSSEPAGCLCLAVYRDKKWPSVVKQILNLKGAELVSWDKSTLRTRLRFTITLRDGSCYDLATDKEDQRQEWIQAFKACGVTVIGDERAPDLGDVKSPGGSDSGAPKPPGDSDSEDMKSPVLRTSIKSPEIGMKSFEEEEDEDEKEPEFVYPLIIQFHTRDTKEHRRLIVAADSEEEQRQWIKAFRESSKPPESSCDVQATSSNFQKGKTVHKGGAPSTAFFVGGSAALGAGGKGGKRAKAKPHWET